MNRTGMQGPIKDVPASLPQGDLQDQITAGYQSPLGVAGTQSLALREVRLQSGFIFDQVQVCYQTLGKLSARRDNAILVCHALSGTAHVAVRCSAGTATGRFTIT